MTIYTITLGTSKQITTNINYVAEFCNMPVAEVKDMLQEYGMLNVVGRRGHIVVTKK